MVVDMTVVSGESRGCRPLAVEGGRELETREATEAVGVASTEDGAVLGVEDVRVCGRYHRLSVAMGGDRLCEC